VELKLLRPVTEISGEFKTAEYTNDTLDRVRLLVPTFEATSKNVFAIVDELMLKDANEIVELDRPPSVKFTNNVTDLDTLMFCDTPWP
jgi:hypothetical protein